jgi:acetyl esterase
LRLQVLLYPCLDLRMRHASYERVGRDFNLTAASMRWFRSQYAPDEKDWSSARLSPLAAPDLTGLAPAILASGGCDPLCDEAAEYETALRAAGVPVKHFHYPGQMHGFVTSGKVLPEGRAAAALVGNEVKQAFG